MRFERRRFLGLSCLAGLGLGAAWNQPPEGSTNSMYGLIGKFTAIPGQRDALARILIEGTKDMPGCLGYVVAADAADPDGLWVTEVWDSKASHEASLKLPAVQAAIADGRPLIAGFGERHETVPLGGLGLADPR